MKPVKRMRATTRPLSLSRSYSAVKQRSQRGFGLIELMISVTLGLLLSAAVIQVFLASSTSSQIQDSLAQVQETGRFSMHFIAKEIRMSGYMGCASRGMSRESAEDFSDAVEVIALPADAVNFTPQDMITGADNVVNGNAWDALPGTDVLILRPGSDSNAQVESVADDDMSEVRISDNVAGFEQGDFVLLADCQKAAIFRVSNEPKKPGEGATTLLHAQGTYNSQSTRSGGKFGPSAEILGLDEVRLFVRDTGRTNDAGNQINALFLRRRSVGGGGVLSNAIELVEGVENMQLLYGVDTNGDFSINQYLAAGAISANPAVTPNWGQVVSVKAQLTVVANQGNVVGEDGSADAQQVVDINGNAVANPDGRLRQVFTNVFALRNKLP